MLPELVYVVHRPTSGDDFNAVLVDEIGRLLEKIRSTLQTPANLDVLEDQITRRYFDQLRLRHDDSRTMPGQHVECKSDCHVRLRGHDDGCR